ncbi:MAG TPA: SpoIIE family protein phosphatase [Bryobacteraceae bacterium]|nr:SpoIIE family protein phosphatase [Bryobacteraceae bacterium]
MPIRPGDYWRRLRWVTKTFYVLALVYAILYITRLVLTLQSLILLGAVFFGLLSLVGLVRRSLRRAIWRLRNRLILAYLMIAVVPIVLGLVLVGIASWAVIGQMAVYLVNSELERRISFLTGPVEGLLRLPSANPEAFVAQFAPLIQRRFPTFEMRIRGRNDIRFPPESNLETPPVGREEANGLILKGSQVYAWVHAAANGNELTLLAPITHELLSHLISGLGDVDLVPYTARSQQSLVPAKQNPLDFELSFIYPVPIALWDSPKAARNGILLVNTRLFAVLDTMFGAKSDWFAGLTVAFVVVSILFFLVELASLVGGIRLSRSITGAVHELYAGTQHVKEGNFTYRIPVRGDDQLADLSASFNTMTENLGRLLVVAKEKERMQSELEIAREVQSQLFPKAAPANRTLKLAAVCHPARAVSGDYYDYMSISEGAVAFAIGDVAGKGISAALLMATIQSAMRTQISATNGGRADHFSTASLVSTLNRQLWANTAPEKYATFYFALYDEARQQLTYTNAGHLPPILMRNGSFEKLEPNGTVVGIFPGAKYEEATVRLEAGDILVAYTDGIVEPENTFGEMFGDDRFQDLLLKYAHADSAEMMARVMEAVVQWTGSSELQDDMTMLVARRV